jgi:hypothetical protein
MATRRKRLRHEEELEEQGLKPAQEAVEEKERPKEREATAAERVLDLQKTAGNRATTAAISRWGIGMLPLAATPQWPKEAEVIIDGVAIPLRSWGWSVGGSGVGGGSTGAAKPEMDEVDIVTAVGKHSSDLALKTARGDPIKTVVVVVPGKDGKGITVTFTDVLISSYSLSGDTESWSMSFAKKEFTQAPPRVQPRP